MVSEKKIRFEIFPDIDMDEWQDQLEEFKKEHEGNYIHCIHTNI